MRVSAPMRGQGLWLVAVLATGCATPGVIRPPSQSPPPLLGAQWTGTASWYGDPHHGRETASGEIFDNARLTAAHRTLPFGTRVAVTNLDNGRTVEVRVNDRGPSAAGRLIDLSEGAARAIGGIGAGLIHVTIRVIALPEGTDAAAGRPPPH